MPISILALSDPTETAASISATQLDAQTILLLIACMLAVFGTVISAYLSVELKLVQRRHRTRRESFVDSEMVQNLTKDQQLSLYNYVLKNADAADRKKVVYQTFRNALMLVGGALPLASIMINNTMIQRIMSVGASIAVLVMGVFTIEANATNHRRTGYMLEMELESWRTGIGNYADKSSMTARFQELVKQVRTVLDSVETSFIGAGADESRKMAEELVFGKAADTVGAIPPVVAAGAIGVAIPAPPAPQHSQEAYGSHSYITPHGEEPFGQLSQNPLENDDLPTEEEFLAMPIAVPTFSNDSPGTQKKSSDSESQAMGDFVSVFGEDGTVTMGEQLEISQAAVKSIAPDDWALWQAEQLAASTDDESVIITQAGHSHGI